MLEKIGALRSTRGGRFFLRVLAIVSFIIVTAPISLVVVLGAQTDWFSTFSEKESLAFGITQLFERLQGWDVELYGVFLSTIPALAFVMVYAGSKVSRLTSFGALVLFLLLGGFLLGLGVAAFLDPGVHQLPCENNNQCIGWLRSKCISSAEQCLTFLLLLVGFDRLSRAPEAVD